VGRRARVAGLRGVRVEGATRSCEGLGISVSDEDVAVGMATLRRMLEWIRRGVWERLRCGNETP
jgi:hypothetical protein